MATHTSDDDELTQMNMKMPRGVKEDLAEHAWRRRISLRELAQTIFEEWLQGQAEAGPEKEDGGHD